MNEWVSYRVWDSYAARIERANLRKTGSSLSRSGIARRAASFILDIQPDRKGMIVRKGWREAMKDEWFKKPYRSKQ